MLCLQHTDTYSNHAVTTSRSRCSVLACIVVAADRCLMWEPDEPPPKTILRIVRMDISIPALSCTDGRLGLRCIMPLCVSGYSTSRHFREVLGIKPAIVRSCHVYLFNVFAACVATVILSCTYHHMEPIRRISYMHYYTTLA